MSIQHTYKPPYADIEVIFVIINPGEAATGNYPGCPPEIEIQDIEQYGDNGSDYELEILRELEK